MMKVVMNLHDATTLSLCQWKITRMMSTYTRCAACRSLGTTWERFILYDTLMINGVYVGAGAGKDLVLVSRIQTWLSPACDT